MKTHRYDFGAPACGVPPESGINAADLSPPEVTCKRCCRVEFPWFDARHYARKNGRLFIVDGLAPDPTRPWSSTYEGPLA